MNISINNKTYQVNGSITITENLGKNLDSAICFVRTTDNLRTIPKFTNVVADNKNWSFYEAEYDSLLDQYKLLLVEPTRIIEELFIKGIAYTNIKPIQESLEDLIYKINLRLDYQNCGYQLHLNQNSSDSANNEELIMSGVHNLREILDAFLQTTNERVRVYSIDDGTIEISVISAHTKRVVNVDVPYYQDSIKSENQANSIVSDAKNVLQLCLDKNVPFSSGGYSFEKSDKAYIPLKNPIRELKHLRMDCTITSIVCGSDILPVNYDSKIDLAKWCCDKEEYDVLDVKEKNTLLFYQRGSKKIENIFTELATWQKVSDSSTYVIDDVINLATNYYFNKTTANEPEILKSYELLTQAQKDRILSWTNGRAFGIRFVPVTEPTFDIEYISATDYLLRVGSGIAITDNQTESNLDVRAYLRQLENKLLLNNQREMDVDSTLELFSLGDSYQNYVCDSIVKNVSDGLTKYHFHLKKNYNESFQDTSLDKTYRVYQIPQSNFIKAVIEVSGYTEFDKAIIHAEYNSAKAKEEPNYVPIDVEIPLISIEERKALRFYDNYCCGYLNGKDGTHLVTKQIRYCDSNGECDTISLTLISGDFETEEVFEVKKDKYEEIEILFY